MPARKLQLGKECPNGHMLDKTNTYIYPPSAKLAGVVVCKVCRMNYTRAKKGQPLTDSIGTWNKNKTHCAKGHEYTAETTYITSEGYRKCRKCHVIGQRNRMYDISHEQYTSLWSEQNGSCAICHNEFAEDSEACIDHSHDTGEVRGLLCNNCNNGLGRFKDNIQYLQSAINYLSGNI